MKEIHFPNWDAVLARTDLPERLRNTYQITIRWYRTEPSYLVWLERFARHVKSDALEERREEDIAALLDALALNERLSASSQRQALNALVFLFREVFGKQLGDFSDFRKAKVRARLPVWPE